MYLLWWDKPQDISEPVALMEDLGEACITLLRSEGFTPNVNCRRGGDRWIGQKTEADDTRNPTHHNHPPG